MLNTILAYSVDTFILAYQFEKISYNNNKIFLKQIYISIIITI